MFEYCFIQDTSLHWQQCVHVWSPLLLHLCTDLVTIYAHLHMQLQVEFITCVVANCCRFSRSLSLDQVKGRGLMQIYICLCLDGESVVWQFWFKSMPVALAGQHGNCFHRRRGPFPLFLINPGGHPCKPPLPERHTS